MSNKKKPPNDPRSFAGPTKPIKDVDKALADDATEHLEGYKETVPRVGKIAEQTKKNDATTSLPPFKK